jgi:hypothetical protein
MLEGKNIWQPMNSYIDAHIDFHVHNEFTATKNRLCHSLDCALQQPAEDTCPSYCGYVLKASKPHITYVLSFQ